MEDRQVRGHQALWNRGTEAPPWGEPVEARQPLSTWEVVARALKRAAFSPARDGTVQVVGALH